MTRLLQALFVIPCSVQFFLSVTDTLNLNLFIYLFISMRLSYLFCGWVSIICVDNVKHLKKILYIYIFMYLYFVFSVFVLDLLKNTNNKENSPILILQGRNLFLGLILISYCYYKTIKGFH